MTIPDGYLPAREAKYDNGRLVDVICDREPRERQGWVDGVNGTFYACGSDMAQVLYFEPTGPCPSQVPKGWQYLNKSY